MRTSVAVTVMQIITQINTILGINRRMISKPAQTHICIYLNDKKQRGLSSISLHDVGLVNSGDLVSPFLGGIIKGKLGDAP